MSRPRGLRPDGRWGGRLTSRPLPEDDPSIAELEPAARDVVVEVWLARAASECVVGDAFAVVHRALQSLEADASLVALAERAVDDEMRHAELARVVACRYAGRELPPPPPLALAVPRHDGAREALRHVLHVVGQCCLNETIATAFLEAARTHTSTPLASAAIRELMADEVDHARIGWATLAAVRGDVRAEVARWLPAMSIANLRIWRTTPRVYPDDPRLFAHGAPPLATVEKALVDAFRSLIVPGFEQLGMDVSRVLAWLDSGAPTPA